MKVDEGSGKICSRVSDRSRTASSSVRSKCKKQLGVAGVFWSSAAFIWAAFPPPVVYESPYWNVTIGNKGTRATSGTWNFSVGSRRIHQCLKERKTWDGYEPMISIGMGFSFVSIAFSSSSARSARRFSPRSSICVNLSHTPKRRPKQSPNLLVDAFFLIARELLGIGRARAGTNNDVGLTEVVAE